MQAGLKFNERDFFKQPFTRAEIYGLLQGRSPAEMFNFNSSAFKQAALNPAELDDEKLVELMLAEPRFIRRPVIRVGGNFFFAADARRLAEILADNT